MKFMSTVLFLLWWGTGGRAETIYLLQESGCADRIRYASTVDGHQGAEYYAYRYPTSQTSDIFFETDASGVRYQQFAPPGMIADCAIPDQHQLIARINSGKIRVAMVRAAGSGYHIEPVIAAAELRRNGQQLTYASPWDGFSIDRSAVVAGTELTATSPGQRVTLEGQSGAACTVAYLVRQERPGTSYPVVSYEIHPVYGVLTRLLIGDDRRQRRGTITARTINDIPVGTFLQRDCARPDRQWIAKSAAPPPAAIVHTVEAGETLYALSRRYGVGVEEIRRVNQLPGNVIRVGQQLRIGAGDDSTQPVVATSVAEVIQPPVEAQPAFRATSSQFHLVQGGETIAGLARRFGYTEERFRSFNGLGRTEQVAPGRQLRTSHCSCPPPVTPAPASAPPAPVEPARVPTPSTYVAPPREQALPAESGYQIPDASSPRPIRIVVPPARPVTEGTVVPDEPAGSVAELTTPPPYTGPERDPRQQRTVHLVREGETLYSIARSYRMTVTRLMELNELGPTDVIAPFQKLYVN